MGLSMGRSMPPTVRVQQHGANSCTLQPERRVARVGEAKRLLRLASRLMRSLRCEAGPTSAPRGRYIVGFSSARLPVRVTCGYAGPAGARGSGPVWGSIRRDASVGMHP